MKSFLSLILVLVLAGPLQAAGDPFVALDRLLKIYVLDDGVDYAAWDRSPGDRNALTDVTETIGEASLEGVDRDGRLAFYLNAYNAWMLEFVMGSYPVDSVTKIGLIPFSVFYTKKIRVAGENMTLNSLEKKIIIREFRDPRIHFAINCASRSCPPLAPDVFAGERLNEQLEALTRAYANSPGAARLDHGKKRVELVEIFKWYDDDFEPSGGPVAFLNRYREDRIPLDYKVDFYPYDWSLNSASER